MKQRPWFVGLMTGTLLLIPMNLVGLYFFTTKVQDMHIPSRIIMNLWMPGIAATVAAIGTWRVRPWGYVMFFIFLVGILGADINHLLGPSPVLNTWEIFNISLIAFGLIIILQRHVRAPYFNPRIRWWERSARNRVELPTTLTTHGQTRRCQLLDISRSGCFLNIEASLAPGEMVSLEISFQGTRFVSMGRVVRISEEPRGVGVAFESTIRPERKNIKIIMKALMAVAAEDAKN